MGDFESCELCDGTGTIIPDRPVDVPADVKFLVMKARYNAGLPLFNPEDAYIPPPIGGSDLGQLFGINGTLEGEDDDTGDEDLLWDVYAEDGDDI